MTTATPLPPASQQLPPLFTAAAACTPPPVLLTQGAEALVYKTVFLTPSRPAALKFRPSKPYRHPVLDRRLTRQRILAEARVLVRLRRERVCVPGVWAADWDAGWLLLEWIPGHTIRACLDRYLHTVLTTSTTSSSSLPAIRESASDETQQPQQQGEAQAHQQEGDERKDPLDKARVPELWDLMARVGRAVASMHAAGVVHGDLTTSNLMLRTPSSSSSSPPPSSPQPQQQQPQPPQAGNLAGTVTIIDFGLASSTIQDEDKAVDLYVLERAFGSTHPAAEPLFREVLRAYEEVGGKKAGAVLRRLEDVRLRGRKRSMVG